MKHLYNEAFCEIIYSCFTKTFHHSCLTVPYHGYFLHASQMFSVVSLSRKVYIYNEM